MSFDAHKTEMVATWIISESEMQVHNGTNARIAEHAAAYAQKRDIVGLRDYLTEILRRAGSHNAAVREVRDELAPNDYGRIDWLEVAGALRASSGAEAAP